MFNAAATVASPGSAPVHHPLDALGRALLLAGAADTASTHSELTGNVTITTVLPTLLLPWHKLSLTPFSTLDLSIRPPPSSPDYGSVEEESDAGSVHSSTSSSSSSSSSSMGQEEDSDPLPPPSLLALHSTLRLVWAAAGGLSVPRQWLTALGRAAQEARVKAWRESEGKSVSSALDCEWTVLCSPSWDCAGPVDVLRVVLASPRPAWLAVYGGLGVQAGGKGEEEGEGEDRDSVAPPAPAAPPTLTHYICNTSALRAFGWSAAEVLHRARIGSPPLRYLLPTHAALLTRAAAEVQVRLAGERSFACEYVGEAGEGREREREGRQQQQGEEGHGDRALEGRRTEVEGYLLSRALSSADQGLLSRHEELCAYADATLLPAISAWGQAEREAKEKQEEKEEEEGGSDASSDTPGTPRLTSAQCEAVEGLEDALHALDDAALYTPRTGVEHVVCWYTGAGVGTGARGGKKGDPADKQEDSEGEEGEESEERGGAGAKRARGSSTGKSTAGTQQEGAVKGGGKRHKGAALPAAPTHEAEAGSVAQPVLRMQAVFFQDLRALPSAHAFATPLVHAEEGARLPSPAEAGDSSAVPPPPSMFGPRPSQAVLQYTRLAIDHRLCFTAGDIEAAEQGRLRVEGAGPGILRGSEDRSSGGLRDPLSLLPEGDSSSAGPGGHDVDPDDPAHDAEDDVADRNRALYGAALRASHASAMRAAMRARRAWGQEGGAAAGEAGMDSETYGGHAVDGDGWGRHDMDMEEGVGGLPRPSPSASDRRKQSIDEAQQLIALLGGGTESGGGRKGRGRKGGGGGAGPSGVTTLPPDVGGGRAMRMPAPAHAHAPPAGQHGLAAGLTEVLLSSQYGMAHPPPPLASSAGRVTSASGGGGGWGRHSADPHTGQGPRVLGAPQLPSVPLPTPGHGMLSPVQSMGFRAGPGPAPAPVPVPGAGEGGGGGTTAAPPPGQVPSGPVQAAASEDMLDPPHSSRSDSSATSGAGPGGGTAAGRGGRALEREALTALSHLVQLGGT